VKRLANRELEQDGCGDEPYREREIDEASSASHLGDGDRAERRDERTDDVVVRARGAVVAEKGGSQREETIPKAVATQGRSSRLVPRQRPRAPRVSRS